MYLVKKGAAITIQGYFRGFMTRKVLFKEHKAATVIQSAYRRYVLHNKFSHLKQATLTVQRIFRAHVLGSYTRTEFLIKKGAVMTLQAAYKGWKVRKRIKQQHQYAKTIQSAFRGYIQHKNYQRLKNAAVLCQKVYRSHVLGSYARKEFIILKNGAITIQAFFRGFMVRKMLKKLNISATKIQSIYRSFKQKQCYLSRRKATKTCQALYRAKITGMKERHKYLTIKISALIIQRFYRLYKIRKGEQERCQAALKIQTCYRSYRGRTEYLKLKQNVIKCQQLYRDKMKGRFCRRQYLCTRSAIVTIQSIIRGWKVRRVLFRQHKAATVIQSACRRYVLHKKFSHLKQATLTVQRIYRAHVLGSYTRTEFLIKKGAVMTLQAAYKGWKVRKGIKKQHQYAKTIQSAFRGYVQHNNYRRLKNAAVICQKVYRAHVLGSYARTEFIKLKNAIIAIQARYRGLKVRQEMKRKNEAATKIQSMYRGYVQYRQFTCLKEVVLSCQKKYRNCIIGARMRKSFLLTKGAIITLQAFIRGWKVRRNVKRQFQAAVVVQSAFRRHIEHKKFTKLKKATVACQKRYRANILSKQIRRQFLIQKGAALVIEDWYCACLQRRKEKQRHRGATVIQNVYRGYRLRHEYRKLKDAAMTIQRHYKNYRTTRQMRNQYLSVQLATIIIQKYCRGYQVRKRYAEDIKHVIRIQSGMKSYLQRKSFIKLKSAALICQKRFRAVLYGYKQRLAFLKVRSAAVLLQSHVRRWQAQRTYKTQLSHIVTIQKCFRGYLAHKNFQSVKKAVHIIQTRWRAVMEMHKIQTVYLTKKGAAITIQSSWKAYLAKKEYKRLCCLTIKLQALVRSRQQRLKYMDLKLSAITIQRHVRAFLTGKNIRMEYIKTKETVVKLQAFVRGNQARMLLKRMKACIIIQSQYKQYICVKNYQRIKRAVITIQSQFRGMLERRNFQKKVEAVVKIQKCVKRRSFANRVKNYLEERRKSAILIQAWYRGYRDRKTVHRLKAVIKIQAVARMKLQRLKYKNHIKNVVVVQSCVRRYLVQKEAGKLRKEISAVTCIQKAFRKFKERQYMKLQKRVRQTYVKKFTKMIWVNLAAITIQRFYRKFKLIQQAKEKLSKIIIIQRWIKGRLCRLRYLKLQRSIVLLQRKARLLLKTRQEAAVKIQTAVRKWLQIKKQKHKIKAIVKLQAIWRGEQVRRKSIGQKIEKIRKRVEKANRSATEENKLGNRMASALDYLLRYKQLSHILEVLIHLDVATRLSAACCEKFVSVNAVHVIYRLMRGCNRSQPHMELIKYSVSILLNLAKYEKTVYEVYNVDGSVDTLIELMQIYREKGAIFNSTCMLLGILGMLDRCRMEIHQDKKLSEKIRSIHLLTARKHKIDESRQLRQARLLAAKSFNCSLPIHHKKTTQDKNQTGFSGKIR